MDALWLEERETKNAPNSAASAGFLAARTTTAENLWDFAERAGVAIGHFADSWDAFAAIGSKLKAQRGGNSGAIDSVSSDASSISSLRDVFSTLEGARTSKHEVTQKDLAGWRQLLLKLDQDQSKTPPTYASLGSHHLEGPNINLSGHSVVSAVYIGRETMMILSADP